MKFDMIGASGAIPRNNLKEMDIVLLHRELMEYNFMNKGMNYDEAHRIAEKTYNYKKYADELDKIFKEKSVKRGTPNE